MEPVWLNECIGLFSLTESADLGRPVTEQSPPRRAAWISNCMICKS